MKKKTITIWWKTVSKLKTVSKVKCVKSIEKYCNNDEEKRKVDLDSLENIHSFFLNAYSLQLWYL